MARTTWHLVDDLNAQIDDLTEGFRSELSNMIEAAKARVIGRLHEALTFEGGVIGSTAKNSRTLRRVAKMLREELERSGVSQLIREFGGTFARQLPLFEEMIELIGSASGRRLSVNWKAADLDLFASRQITVESGLETIIESAALAAQRRVMFSAGGLPFGDLVDALGAGMRVPIAEAVTLAETSQATFWRTITDQGFRQLGKKLPKRSLRYRFVGPADKFTRPFCRDLLKRTKRRGLTREQIDKLDNGQLPNVFHTGGGFKCRHQWVAEIETR